MIGKKLAHSEVTAKLGEGGMGEVFRAMDTRLEREVTRPRPEPPPTAPERTRRGRLANHPVVSKK